MSPRGLFGRKENVKELSTASGVFREFKQAHGIAAPNAGKLTLQQSMAGVSQRLDHIPVALSTPQSCMMHINADVHRMPRPATAGEEDLLGADLEGSFATPGIHRSLHLIEGSIRTCWTLEAASGQITDTAPFGSRTGMF